MKLTLLLQIALALLALGSGTMAVAAQTLDYSEGAPPTEDPAATDQVPAVHRVYVDAVAGNDTSDGRSPATAWRSINKVNASASTFQPGTYVLFKRGETFSGDLTPGEVQGRAGQRIVFGAYGQGHSDGDYNPFNESRPIIPGRVLFAASKPAQWVMVRDLDTRKISFGLGAPHSDVVIFNNVVHGTSGVKIGNLIGIGDNVTRCAIVQNLIYDGGNNDLIALHSSGGVHSVGSSHWIVDNVIVGNREVEGGIDFQIGDESENPPHNEDYKLIGNRIQMRSGTIPGVKQSYTGSGGRGIEGGHVGRHIWIMGNMITGAAHPGLFTGGLKHHCQISGNILWRNGTSGNDSMEFTSDDTLFEHNTILHTARGRFVLELRSLKPKDFLFDSLRWTVRQNLFVRTNDGVWFQTWDTGHDAIVSMDRNWYGNAISGTLNNRALIDWQKSTGHDAHSESGDVPGLSVPSSSIADENPLTWYEPQFLAHFTPAPGWAGNKLGGDTPPGALRSDGTWCGGGPAGARQWNPRHLFPFPTLQLNHGYGWAGPLLVQQRYPLPPLEKEPSSQ